MQLRLLVSEVFGRHGLLFRTLRAPSIVGKSLILSWLSSESALTAYNAFSGIHRRSRIVMSVLHAYMLTTTLSVTLS